MNRDFVRINFSDGSWYLGMYYHDETLRAWVERICIWYGLDLQAVSNLQLCDSMALPSNDDPPIEITDSPCDHEQGDPGFTVAYE